MNRHDRILRTCTSWETLWRALLKGLKDNTAGDLLERFTQLYFQTDPEYRIKLKPVWRCLMKFPQRFGRASACLVSEAVTYFVVSYLCK